MSRFLQDAIKTERGYAHPLTGELIATRRNLDSPVSYYRRNAGQASFIDPDGEVDGLVMFQKLGETSLTVKFALHLLRRDVSTIEWDFGDGTEAQAGNRNTRHTFETAGEYTVDVSVKYQDDSTSVYSVTIQVG